MTSTMETGKALVFGGGFLGGIMADYFGAGAPSSVDVTDLQAVRKEIADLKPDFVINAAALTNTSQLELPENQDEGYRVNVQGAANVAMAAFEKGILMVHISTAMMFDGNGTDGQGIREWDVPEPRSYYALTKAWADAQLVPLMQDQVLIARIHTPISCSASPKNLLTKMIAWDKAVDGQSSVTVVEDFLPALSQLITKKARGIYNIVNEGSISFYEIAQLMQKGGLISSDKNVQPVSVEDFQAGIEKAGTSYQPFPILNIDKLRTAGISMPPAGEAIESAIKNYVK